tara:strand:+ start:2454 stop:3350 length:897 start_codon:yes stop_codon:yes gene_type:complete
MVSWRLENTSPDNFSCIEDRDDDECGVFNNKTSLNTTTGEITCLVCMAIVGKENEDDEADYGGADEEDTSDEDYTDDGDENVRDTGDKDITTEWDAEKKKLEAEKEALRKLADLLSGSTNIEAKNFADTIRRDFNRIMGIHKILNSSNFYNTRMYKKKMMLCSSLIYAINELKYKLTATVVEEAGEEIQQIRPIVLEGLRKVKGIEEGPIQSWMRIHDEAAGLSKELVDEAINYFREAEPKMVIADDEIKALAWLLLTARTAGEPLTMSKLQKISGRSRQSIGRVVKAYAPYFEEPNL